VKSCDFFAKTPAFSDVRPFRQPERIGHRPLRYRALFVG
jgi:hypothetical protein